MLDIENEIQIARDELVSAKLFSKNKIITEMFFCPSHTYQTYYSVVYSEKDIMKMVYAKTLIYTIGCDEPIKSCAFSKCKLANSSSDSKGTIVMGSKLIRKDMRNALEEIIENMNGFSYECQENMIDGVDLAIRVFDNEYDFGELPVRLPAKRFEDLKKNGLDEKLHEMFFMIEKFLV